VELGRQLRWNSVDLVDSCGGTWWIVAVELGGQLRLNLVDSCGGTWWIAVVELSK